MKITKLFFLTMIFTIFQSDCMQSDQELSLEEKVLLQRSFKKLHDYQNVELFKLFETNSLNRENFKKNFIEWDDLLERIDCTSPRFRITNAIHLLDFKCQFKKSLNTLLLGAQRELISNNLERMQSHKAYAHSTLAAITFIFASAYNYQHFSDSFFGISTQALCLGLTAQSFYQYYKAGKRFQAAVENKETFERHNAHYQKELQTALEIADKHYFQKFPKITDDSILE